MKAENILKRAFNILNKAVSLGFELNEGENFHQLVAEAAEFLIENEEPIEVNNQLEKWGYDWSDGQGFDVNVNGELYTYEERQKAELNNEGRLIYDRLVDTDGNVIALYHHF